MTTKTTGSKLTQSVRRAKNTSSEATPTETTESATPKKVVKKATPTRKPAAKASPAKKEVAVEEQPTKVFTRRVWPD